MKTANLNVIGLNGGFYSLNVRMPENVGEVEIMEVNAMFRNAPSFATAIYFETTKTIVIDIYDEGQRTPYFIELDGGVYTHYDF